MENRININKAISILLLVFLPFFYLSCGVKKHSFIGRVNPTEYVFNMPLEELRILVINDFENPANPDVEEIFSRGMRVIPITKYLNGLTDSVSYTFYQIKSVNDLVLQYPIGTYSTTLGYSDVYYKKNMPLLYSANFHLHFEQINLDKTKIKIYVINPKVAVGNQIICIPSHCGYRWKKVEPTTIEEYKILLRIGKLAGEKNMPPLSRPWSRLHVPRWP